MDSLEGRNVPALVDDVEVIEPKPLKQRAHRVREVTTETGIVAWEYSDGSIRNDKGHMLKPLPGTDPITHENARSMLERKRKHAIRAQLRGMAKSAGMDPSEIDDELIEQAATAYEAQTMHFAKTFMESRSLRDMTGAYGQLSAIMVGDKAERAAEHADDSTREFVRDLADIARAYLAKQD